LAGANRPKKQEIAQTSNTEPQVAVTTVVLQCSGLARLMIIDKNSRFELTTFTGACAEKIPWREHENKSQLKWVRTDGLNEPMVSQK
jgi:hypothetical protein